MSQLFLRYRFVLISAVLAAALIALPKVSLADQIDGHWCYKDGTSFSIRGPQMVTPGGKKIQGQYDRHGFAYTVPMGEKGTGDKIAMIQQNDKTVHLWRKKPSGSKKTEYEVWNRCDQKMS